MIKSREVNNLKSRQTVVELYDVGVVIHSVRKFQFKQGVFLILSLFCRNWDMVNCVNGLSCCGGSGSLSNYSSGRQTRTNMNFMQVNLSLLNIVGMVAT